MRSFAPGLIHPAAEGSCSMPGEFVGVKEGSIVVASEGRVGHESESTRPPPFLFHHLYGSLVYAAARMPPVVAIDAHSCGEHDFRRATGLALLTFIGDCSPEISGGHEPARGASLVATALKMDPSGLIGAGWALRKTGETPEPGWTQPPDVVCKQYRSREGGRFWFR